LLRYLEPERVSTTGFVVLIIIYYKKLEVVPLILIGYTIDRVKPERVNPSISWVNPMGLLYPPRTPPLLKSRKRQHTWTTALHSAHRLSRIRHYGYGHTAPRAGSILNRPMLTPQKECPGPEAHGWRKVNPIAVRAARLKTRFARTHIWRLSG